MVYLFLENLFFFCFFLLNSVDVLNDKAHCKKICKKPVTSSFRSSLDTSHFAFLVVKSTRVLVHNLISEVTCFLIG